MNNHRRIKREIGFALLILSLVGISGILLHVLPQPTLGRTTVQTQTPIPTGTLTGPELDATKYAYFAQESQTVVAAMTMFAIATPVPVTFVPTVTVAPIPSPELGHHSCGGADRFFDAHSCWTEQVGNEYMSLVSGAPKSDPTQSTLLMITSTLSQQTFSPVMTYTAPSRLGAIHIAYVDMPRVTLITARENSTITRLVFNILTRTWENPGSCQLFPIALNAIALTGDGEDARYITRTVSYGTGNGNFGWLSWNSDILPETLVPSLTMPGNSNIYINPDNPADHIVSIGDWVSGRPEVSGNQAISSALDVFAASHYRMIVPVWDQATDQGNTLRYHVSGFAWIYAIEDYSVAQPNHLSFRYWGPATCPYTP